MVRWMSCGSLIKQRKILGLKPFLIRKGDTKTKSYPDTQKHPVAPAKHFGSCPEALYALLHLDTVSSFNTSCDTLNYLASRYPEEDNGYFVANAPNKHRVPLKYLRSFLENQGKPPILMK